MKYRQEVINSNLRRVFPTKSASEIAQLRSQFYAQLSTTFCESMYLYAHPSGVADRMKYFGIEEIEKDLAHGKNVIIAGGHLYNWEWTGAALGQAISYPVVGIYKPLSNPYFEKHLTQARTQLNVELIPMRLTAKHIASRVNNGHTSVYAFGADQSPTHLPKSIWLDFFGVQTPFFPGIDKFASKYDMAVYYLDVTCPRRGHYVGSVKKLSMKDGSYVASFAEELKRSITANPVAWLWSHKRWKHSKQRPAR